MAEIKIERRSKKPIWPWIVGLVLLLLFAWGLVEFFEASAPLPEEDMAATEVETTRLADEPAPYEPSGRVNEFVNFVQQEEREAEMGPGHEYTSEGIQKLSAALTALAEEEAPEDVAISEKKQRLQESARQIQQNPESLQHANSIKDAFTLSADLLESIQEHAFPERESAVEAVKEAAGAVETDVPTLEQEAQIKQFFSETSEVLKVLTVPE